MNSREKKLIRKYKLTDGIFMSGAIIFALARLAVGGATEKDLEFLEESYEKIKGRKRAFLKNIKQI